MGHESSTTCELASNVYSRVHIEKVIFPQSPVTSYRLICRAEITKQLIQQRGFNAVGAEAGMLLPSALYESLFRTSTKP